MFPVTVPLPLSVCTPLCFPSILLTEVGVMWSSAAGLALPEQMKLALRGPCLLPARCLWRWMEGSTSQAPQEEITDEGVEGMRSSLNSLVEPQLHPLAPGPLWRADDVTYE